jgi:macrolide transport system ATP-binding/permease protein
VESLLTDLRYALRSMARRPGFTLAAVLSLALGIGANTTVFGLVDVLLLRTLPVADPGRLVRLYTLDARHPGAPMPMVSHLNWKDYREQARSFTGILGYDTNPISVVTGGEAFMTTGQLVSENYFQLLGVHPRLGRTFSLEEATKLGAHPVVVVSDHFWRQQLGADPAAVGRTIKLDGHPYTVIGVAPEGFSGCDLGLQSDLWVPMSMNRQISPDPSVNWYETRRGLFIFAVGRLRPGVTLAAARAEMTAIARRLEQDYAQANKGRTVVMTPLPQATLPPGQREKLTGASWMLLGIVALVLLIACANVANLLLARALSRRREIAVRLSQGAGRGRLVRQLLTESLLLALLGGAAGLLLMIWADRALVAFLASLPNPVTIELGVDLRVLAFTLAVSVLTGLVFGLAPALQSTRPQLVTALKTQAAAAPAAAVRGMGLRGALVAGEVGLALVVLIAAGLFLRSLAAAQRIDPGYDTGRLLTMSFDAGLYGLDQGRGEQLFRAVRERVAALPGVEAAALAQAGPMQLSVTRSVFLEGQENPDNGLLVQVDAVDPAFFRTMGVPVVAGRGFLEADRQGAPAVALVNRTLAGKYWPHQDAVGKRFHFHGTPPIEVVGVARDAKYTDLAEEPQPYVYLPLAQNYAAGVTLMVRASQRPAALLPAVERQVHALAPGMPLVGAGTLADTIETSLWAPRLAASLLGLFAALALALAAVGIYGVMSFSVAQRSRDIGIRMALGARRGKVMSMIVGQGMVQVACGLAGGFAVALAGSRLAASLLIATSPTDPVAFAATPLLLALIALLALYAPARRATRVDPTLALRSE